MSRVFSGLKGLKMSFLDYIWPRHVIMLKINCTYDEAIEKIRDNTSMRKWYDGIDYSKKFSLIRISPFFTIQTIGDNNMPWREVKPHITIFELNNHEMKIIFTLGYLINLISLILAFSPLIIVLLYILNDYEYSRLDILNSCSASFFLLFIRGTFIYFEFWKRIPALKNKIEEVLK